MAATVEIRSFHGATPDSGTNVASGSVRFKQADNDTVDANNPIPIPAAGTNYSFVKQFRFYAATTPANTINNLKFYTDGANGFGTGVGMTASAPAAYAGTATSGTTTSLTDSGANFGTEVVGMVLEITGGTNSGQSRRITVRNSATQVTVASAFPSAIDATSVYRIAYVDPVNLGSSQLNGGTGQTDAFTYTSGSPLSVAGSINNPSTGAFGDYVRCQMSAASTASQGTTPTENLTFSYDES